MNLRLVVVRIPLGQLLHRLRVGLNAGAMIDFVVIGVHHRKRVDVVTFALGPGADAFPFAIAAAPSARFFAGGAT